MTMNWLCVYFSPVSDQRAKLSPEQYKDTKPKWYDLKFCQNNFSTHINPQMYIGMYLVWLLFKSDFELEQIHPKHAL